MPRLEEGEQPEPRQFCITRGTDGLLHYSVIDPSGAPVINQIIRIEEIEESHRAAFELAMSEDDLCKALRPFLGDILKITSQKGHTLNVKAPAKELNASNQLTSAIPEFEPATNALAGLVSAIRQNYGETLNEFSVWHSRTVTARRLANLNPNLTPDQLRLILEVEINAKQRAGALNTQPKSRSFFPNIPEKTLVDRLQQVFDTLSPVYTVDDEITGLKKEIAELLLDWVDQEERSLSYKLFHHPGDAVGQKLKEVGEIAHKILLCPLSFNPNQSVDTFVDQNTARKTLFDLKYQLALLLDGETRQILCGKFDELKQKSDPMQPTCRI